jgi:hypothetical protein
MSSTAGALLGRSLGRGSGDYHQNSGTTGAILGAALPVFIADADTVRERDSAAQKEKGRPLPSGPSVFLISLKVAL